MASIINFDITSIKNLPNSIINVAVDAQSDNYIPSSRGESIEFNNVINPDFEIASPIELKNAVMRGCATSLYTVGATKKITLKTGQIITLRLANNTTDMYEYADKTGTTGFVLEFVDMYSKKYYMNYESRDKNGWSASYMRNTVLPIIFEQLPDDWQQVISEVKIKGSNGYSLGNNILIESNDKLFLPAERETSPIKKFCSQIEWDALSTWQYYSKFSYSNRVKQLNGVDTAWWLRSPCEAEQSFCIIYSDGDWFHIRPGIEQGVAPAFCI